MDLHLTRAAAKSERLHLFTEEAGHSRRRTELFSEGTRALSSGGLTHAVAPEVLSGTSGVHTAGTRAPFGYVGRLSGLMAALADALRKEVKR